MFEPLQSLILNILKDICFGRWIHCAPFKPKCENVGGFCQPRWGKAAEHMLAAQILCTVCFFLMVCTVFAQLNHLFTKWIPVITIHIPDCLHLKTAPDQFVWSVSANTVLEEILHSQIHWGSWGSSGLITLKDLNRINPHQIHNSQRLAFKSPGSWSKHLHTLVYIFFALSPISLYNCVWITECFFFQNSKFFFVFGNRQKILKVFIYETRG